ncbi:MAG: ECF-type sigma factor [Limisphaerales bacterium]
MTDEPTRIDGPHAAEDIFPLVYEDLRRLAAVRMAEEKPGQTLQPTALVHEVWLRLSAENHAWASRRQFFAAAAEAMRRILVERARRRARIRHGGGFERARFEDLDVAETADPEIVLRVHEALDELAREEPLGAELIKLRFFAGMSNVEAAEVLGMAERTAKRTWAYSRAWLYEAIGRRS